MTTREDSDRHENRASAVEISGSSRGLCFTGTSVAWHSCESAEPHLEPRQDSLSHALIYLNLTVFRPVTTSIGNCTLLVTEAGDTMLVCCETIYLALFTSACLPAAIGTTPIITTMIRLPLREDGGCLLLTLPRLIDTRDEACSFRITKDAGWQESCNVSTMH